MLALTPLGLAERALVGLFRDAEVVVKLAQRLAGYTSTGQRSYKYYEGRCIPYGVRPPRTSIMLLHEGVRVALRRKVEDTDY